METLGLEARKRLTLAATILGSSLAFIDATVVIVALPTIEEDLDLGLTGQQWIFLSYSLALASLYLVGGAVGDRYGRRRVFIAGAAGFALASLLAGAAPNEATLIVARTLQGVAGAFLTTNSLALLRGVYGADSGRAIGLWTSFTSVATIAGPPAGGALVEWVSWRWIFLLNLPLAAATVFLALAGRCNEAPPESSGGSTSPARRWPRQGSGLLTYGLVEGVDRGFGTIWWAFVGAVAALAAFVVVEQRVAQPMLPFELFRVRNFAVANAQTFLVYAGLYGFFVFFTIYLQFIGFTAFEAGLLNIPSSIIMILLAARFGALADKHGPRLYLTVGPALMGTGTLVFMFVDDKSDFWTAGIAGLAIFSLGLAMMVAPITATALKSAPERYAGIASGVNSTVSRLGSLIAIALIGLVITLVFESRTDVADAVPLARDPGTQELYDASVDAFRAGMLLAAALTFAGAAVGGIGISNREARGEEAPAVSEQAPAPAGS